VTEAPRAALLNNGLRAGWSAWRYAGRLREWVTRLAPDVVHSNSLKYHLLSALAVPRGTRLVWHLHDFVASRPVMSRCLRWAAGRAAGALAVSHAVAEDAGGRLGKLPILVVPNAIDTDHFRPSAPQTGAWLDELAGLPPAAPGTVRVGLVATYARWKGQDVFLDAATRLAREDRQLPVRFYLVGGPIYQTRGSQWAGAELEARSAGLCGEKQIGFIPFQRDTAPVYRGLDVVVHASTRPEPFGLTIAEAMACGRPVIAARAGGAAELITHDHDAVAVTPGDPAALAEAIRQLARDPAGRQRLGDAARQTAEARFARSRLGPQLLASYQSFRPGKCAA
jgi:glycosyltransferase involved in cell wall biosynthesis